MPSNVYGWKEDAPPRERPVVESITRAPWTVGLVINVSRKVMMAEGSIVDDGMGGRTCAA